jgi:hypothetical protein
MTMYLPPESRDVSRLPRLGEAAVDGFETAASPDDLFSPGAAQAAWVRFVDALAGGDDARH